MEKKFNLGLRNYSKKFNKIIFDDINVELKDQFVCLLGDNGSGKTTLLKALYQSNKDFVSYIKQNFHLFEKATVKDNIQLISKQIDYNLLKRLKIDNLLAQKVINISAGERQRLICYISLMIENNWIFLDEIDNHLDIDNVENYYSLLKEKESNYLIVSHHKNIINKYCNQELIIKNHKINEIIKSKPNIKIVNKQYHCKPISLIKLFLKKSSYLFLLLINALLCTTSISFSSLDVDEVIQKYYQDSFNYQVEPILFKNDRQIISNYNTLSFLKDTTLFSNSYIDLNSLLSNIDGFYLDDVKLENLYVDDIFNEPLSFDNNNTNVLEIYLSSLDRNKNNILSFRFKDKQFILNDETYDIDINTPIIIKGYLDIPKGYCIYNYNQYENYLNSQIILNESGLIDIIKQNPIFLNTNFDNVKFLAILNELIPINKLKEQIQIGELTLKLFSKRLIKYQNQYNNFIVDTIIFNTISIISIILIFAIASYFIINFYVKYYKIFESFYLIYGLNKIDIIILITMTSLLFILGAISLLLFIFI